MRKINKKILVSSVVLFFMIFSNLVLGKEGEKLERIKIKEENDKKSVLFFDEKGRKVKEIKLKEWEDAFVSQRRKYVAIQNPAHWGKYKEISIFDSEGKIKRKQNVLPYGATSISDDGSFVVFGHIINPSMTTKGGIGFYNAHGELIKKVELTPTSGNFGVHFYNGKYFVILSGEIKNKIQVVLRCYTIEGTEIWNYYFEDGYHFKYPEFLEVIDQAKKIKVKLYYEKERDETIFIFDKDGKLLMKKKEISNQ